ncbi:MAG: hypothetical protein ACFB2W_26325 [Leptolyngbyaceae cyanobacterium]|mgnify:CR=1 FL=1
MLGKLFGKKSKKDGYFLELSEEELEAIPEPIASAVSAVVPVAESKAAKDAPAKSPEPSGDAKPAAQNAPAKSAVPTLDKSVSKAAAAMPQVAATPQATTDPLELIRTAIAESSKKSQAKAESTEPFDYTTPVAKAGRRRPGPSMSPFKSIAKDMKKTSSGF